MEHSSAPPVQTWVQQLHPSPLPPQINPFAFSTIFPAPAAGLCCASCTLCATLCWCSKVWRGTPKSPLCSPGFAALSGDRFPCSPRSSTCFIIRTANFICISQTAFASPRAEMRSPMAETSLLLLDTSHGVGCRVVRHYHNPPAVSTNRCRGSSRGPS